MPKPKLTVDLLREEAESFAMVESDYDGPSLFEVADGKAVRTYMDAGTTDGIVQVR